MDIKSCSQLKSVFDARNIFLALTCFMCVCVQGTSSSVLMGHMKPFGCCNPAVDTLAEVDGWPRPAEMFKEHIIPSKPLLMKNAANVSHAYKKWTDEYFSSLNLSSEAKITVMPGNKEVWGRSPELVEFKDWIQLYNDSQKYVMQGIPGYLGKDVVTPPSLQCSSLMEDSIVVESMIWFSSGETKSLVRASDFHNIECVYDGYKHVILANPTLYKDKVPLNQAEGTVSTLDVEKVDLEEYPELADVKYYNVTVENGDCLFIPASWVYQINAYQRNIGVDVWFERRAGDYTNLSNCVNDFYDPTLTLDKIPRQGPFSEQVLLDAVLSLMFDYFVSAGNISFDEFHGGILKKHMDIVFQEAGLEYTVPLKKMFQSFDHNSDGRITADEYENSLDKHHEAMAEEFIEIREILRVAFKNRPDIFSDVFKPLVDASVPYWETNYMIAKTNKSETESEDVKQEL